MYEVRVTADFAAAHFLRDYNGKCENLHGHNYKVYVHVRGEKLNEGGMLLDFTLLKTSLREVIGKLDLEYFEQNPSAERIATYIYEKIIDLMSAKGTDLSYSTGKKDAVLYAVDVFETDSSRARYIPYP